MSTVESSIDTVYIDIINAGVTATATGGSTVALIVRFTKNLRKKNSDFFSLASPRQKYDLYIVHKTLASTLIFER